MSPSQIQILMIVLMLGIMYFLLIRPQKKQEKAIKSMRNNLKVGDDVITIGGIVGKIVRIKDDRLTIQVGADKMKFDVEKWAISKVIGDEPQKSNTKKAAKEEEPEEEKKVTPKRLKKLGKTESSTEVAETPTETPKLNETTVENPAEE